MGKRILLITSLYPSPDVNILNNTAVCHYFAKEWKNLGYDVCVIFCYNIYPWYYYPILHLFRKKLANIMGVSIQDVRVSKVASYDMDGITVTRIPILKNRPGGIFIQRELDKTISIIKQTLLKQGFRPDYILGHFIHPSLELVSILKEEYNAVCAVSLHGPENRYSEADAKLFDMIDFIGYRSYPTKESFEKIYGPKSSFMCFSGVPEEFIVSEPRSFDRGIHDFIYVGAFMKRKYPACLVPAISKCYPEKDFAIYFVGDGDDRYRIVKEAEKNKVTDKVKFTGRLKREEITLYLDLADVFIMISKTETFGLVYLEAMSRGCIVVASKNEGMQGIIQHGKNGFLCEAGNTEELSKIVSHIKSLSTTELMQISKNSLETARSMTDKKVAYNYITEINK